MQFNFPTKPREAGKGTLISFLPLRAGAGAATLACMCSLTAVQHYDTAIIDFNFESKVKTYLGFQDLEASNLSILDVNGITNPEGVYSASEQHHSGLKVFPGVSSKVLDALQVDTHLTLKATRFLKQTSQLTIAVLSPLFTSSWIVAMLSDLVCLVVKPDRPNMDAFRETVDFMGRLGCSERLKIILNQTEYPGSLETRGSVNFFSPDVVIPYRKEIPVMCNKRNLQPNRNIRNELFKLVKGAEDINA